MAAFCRKLDSYFTTQAGYPFAIKVATGKINAVTGEGWRDGLHRNPQDYLIAPDQPWLDGYCVERGVIRQFVAMPLGEGYTAEEQITGAAEHGGHQIAVYPMKREAYERLRSRRRAEMDGMVHCLRELEPAPFDMGLAPGGRMEQEIYDDPHALADWDQRHRARCFVHLANSLVWKAITGEAPPTQPPTAADYTRAGLPWFEFYAADTQAVDGAEQLGALKSVNQLGAEKGETPLPENESTSPTNVIGLGARSRRGGRVREGALGQP